jgi:hypothetical protein
VQLLLEEYERKPINGKVVKLHSVQTTINDRRNSKLTKGSGLP